MKITAISKIRVTRTADEGRTGNARGNRVRPAGSRPVECPADGNAGRTVTRHTVEIMEVRRATVADAAALTRMRALMLDAMGRDVGAAGAPWRKAADDWFAEQLGRTDMFAAFVVDDPDLGVVCSAVGICDGHAPGPGNLGGLSGHVFNVSTDPRRRRRGLARLCMTALVDWFRDEAGVSAVGLHATGDGIALYESLGFAPPRFPELKLRFG